MQKAVAVIPARFNSTRFPGKPLATLRGKIVIQHVYEHATSAKLVDAVFVATDDKRIFDAVTSFGGRAVMTSVSHASGTDRIAEAVSGIECDYVVNVQGDEPFIRAEMIDDVIELLYNDDEVSISTLAKKITDTHELMTSHTVKVVMNSAGFAMYFSRAPIPFDRDAWQARRTEYGMQLVGAVHESPLRDCCWYKHIGIYGYKKNTLMAFTSLKEGRLEQLEKLEQLRALEAGMKIKVKITEHDTFGIDTIEDLRKAEEWQNLSL
jgi:3-deoxy-manno-octulosonate cytidylyltransferase (CMP-KDO synthetase)